MLNQSLIRDMRPVDCKLFDREDKLIGSVKLTPPQLGAPPRRIEYDGKAYIEGDGSGFYGENEFAEVVR